MTDAELDAAIERSALGYVKKAGGAGSEPTELRLTRFVPHLN
jgi:hypothetical protein